MFDSILQADKEALIFLNSLGTDFWDPFWLGITNQKNWVPLFIFIIFLLFKSFGWKKALFILLVMILLVAFSDQFTNLIKNSFERLRPNRDPSINYLLRRSINPKGYSFMSGHATTSTFFTVFSILVFRHKYRYIYLMLIFPLVFAYSRLYLGVHFPIDIFVGFTIGTSFAILYFRLFKLVFQKIFKDKFTTSTLA
jgi:undecaprenyl-diphosphatase